MSTVAPTSILVTFVFASLALALANVATQGIAGGSQIGRMAAVVALLVPVSLLLLYLTKQFSGPPKSLFERAISFVGDNFWVYGSVLATLVAGQILGLTVLGGWCQNATKDPCSPQGLIASEICPNTGTGHQFTTCVQDEAVEVMKEASNDLRFASSLVSNSFAGLADAMNAARGQFNQIRTGVEGAFTSLLNGVLASSLPALRSGLQLKGMMGQMQAVLASVAYLFLSGLMSMRATIGGFLQVSDTSVEILGGTLAVMLAVMFFAPWLAVPAAVIAGILAIVAEPLILVSDMAKGLGIQW